MFDCEGDGLRPTKFYCLSYKDHEGKKETLRDYEDIRSFFSRYELYVGHNIRRWDLPQLRRLTGIQIPDRVVDTLGVAWYLDPNRGNHRLEGYGEDFGIPKPLITDWEGLTQEEYENRCRSDVEINFELWKSQLRRLLRIYDDQSSLWAFLRYLDFKLWSAHLAEESGWKLDLDGTRDSIKRLSSERERKTVALAQAMPRVPVTTVYKPPKRLRNTDGQPSVLGLRWTERVVEAGLQEGYEGPIEVVTGYDDPNPNSSPQIKSWLYSLGWKPQTFKENDKGVQVPQINLPNGGGICESIALLYEKEPALQHLDSLSVLGHRLGILNGYLRDVDSDGYLRACVAGLTNTLRFKHTEIVNLPKAEKPYGTDIRGPLVAPSDHELCGSDMVSLEDRIKQHFIWPHDPDYVATLNTDGYDPHLDLAFLAGALTSEQCDVYKLVDKANAEQRKVLEHGLLVIYKTVKPIRSIYKNGNYACQYGAGPPRLTVTCGCDLETARRVHQTYWKRNWAIKAVAKEQTVKTIEGQMWLLNPINHFWYSLRTEKDIFSTLVQGSAAYVFDRYLAEVLASRPQVTGQFHDEFILTVKKGHREEITAFLNECIREVNESLNLNRELGISIQFGDRYSEIH